MQYRILLPIILLTILISSTHGQVVFDTVTTMNVGVGVKYYKVLSYAAPYSINILEVDLKNGYNSVETVKANDRLNGYERTSSMAARNSFPGHRVVGAVNGDFYGSGGVPINIQIKNGQILRNPISLSTLGFDIFNNPMLKVVNFSGDVKDKLNQSNQLHGVNKTRETNQLILFNRYMGATSGTNIYGTELLVKPIGGWIVNDTVKLVVTNKQVGVGSMAIPDSFSVLSGHGTAATFLNGISIGDTIKLVQKVLPGLPKLKEMMGGFPKIVNNGLNYAVQGFNEEGGPSHAFEKHPRTAAGFSQDSSKLYLITVDGRMAASAGMTLVELADFMVQCGIYYGINFDGGGSTTMVMRDSVVNVYSDGAERTVANALLIVSSVPDDTLSSIQLTPKKTKLYRNSNLQFRVTGWDNYFNKIPVNPNEVTFSCTPGLGTINNTGIFTAGELPNVGYIYADYKGYRDSAFLEVQSIQKIVVLPKQAVIDSIRTLNFKMTAYDPNNTIRPLSLNEYTWNVVDPQIGVIDTLGKLRGLKEGTTKVIVTYQNVKDTAEVTVQIGTGSSLINSLDDVTGWIFSGENIDTINSTLSISNTNFSQGSGAFKIDYKFTYDPSKNNWIYLNNDIPVYGLPDSIIIDAKTDGQQHHISYLVTDENDELFRINTGKYATETTFFDNIRANTHNAGGITTGASYYFPIRIKQIGIKLGSPKVSGQTYTGTIYLDNFRLLYPSSLTNIGDESHIPSKFYLYQNYPNPFNPVTKIVFDIPYLHSGNEKVNLKIYDVLGNEIVTLVDEYKSPGKYQLTFNTQSYNISSGVYFYRLTSGHYNSTKKMLLLK
ncbi:MAG TPA: phosphodiester glycosidase family protein [Ignavibacteriaceae bacterium]|nr:phosphodiester glycosidase family protein [Ignavibacteriaceae bacterium]